MTVLPIRWQGRSRLERLRAELAGRCENWLDEWSASARDCRVELDLETPRAQSRSASMASHWQELRAGEACLRFALPAAAFELWGKRLLGTSEADATGLAEGVGRRAFAGLAQAIMGATEAQPARIERPSSQQLDSRHGVAAMVVTLAGVSMSLYLDAAVCDRLAPLTAPAAVPLTRREAAVGAGEIAFLATLDLGQSALEQTLNLRPGEIIKTAMRLDAPLQLRAMSGDAVLSATLTHHDGARALRVVALSRQHS